LVALEVGMGQAELVSQMMSRALPASEMIIKKDLAGINRVVLLKIH
jgi:methylase of polypeptide subunit release factors